ncbi:MAG: hypothetical protein NVS3B12_06950 [Acidimicrobiales bacterium]
MTVAERPNAEELQVLIQYRLVEALQEREHDLAEAQRVAHLGSWAWDLRAGVVTWSDEMYRIFGVATSTTPTMELALSCVHPDDRDMVKARTDALDGSEASFSFEHRIVVQSAVRWVRERGAIEVGDDGVVVRVHGTAQDVTDSAVAERTLAELNRRFAVLAHASDATIVALYDADGTLVFSTPEAEHHLGRSPDDGDAADWSHIHPQDVGRVREGFDAVFQTPGAKATVVYRLAAADGRWRTFEASAVNGVHTDGLRGILVSTVEVSGRSALGRGSGRAGHDPLTGVASYASVVAFADQALVRAERAGWSTAVLVVDIDRFNEINDAFGPDAGDEVLIELAARLRETFRGSDSVGRSDPETLIDVVGRLGGDRFVIVCENVADEGAAETVANRARQALVTPIVVGDGQAMHVTVGVGVSVAAPGGTGVAQRIIDAEEALRRAKSRGTDQHCVAGKNIIRSGRRHGDAERALRRALDEHEFLLHYQPKVSFESHCLTGVEALLRWEDPERGLVPPLDFIPLAESSGLIVPIGTWVLQEACRQAAEWQARFPRRSPLVMSVNVSGHQFGADLIESVVGALDGADARALCLEVTESVLIGDPDAAVRILTGLSERGVKLSIDDFGTGYSSLSYLKRFPLDELKIDKSFVDGLGNDTNDTAIVAATVAMAHALGLSVISEGVETTEQYERLRVLGCQEAQGYLISRPLPAEAIPSLLTPDVWQVWNQRAEPDRQARSYRPKRIVVVDDTADVRQLARMTLTAAGFDVEEASGGVEALSVANRIRPDCVILDASMPDMSGIEVCRALRADPATAACTIVMLTSNDGAADKVDAFSSGVDDYVLKPFSPRDLTSRVRAAMRRRAEALGRSDDASVDAP